MTDRRKCLLILNGVGQPISAVLSGWPHFY